MILSLGSINCDLRLDGVDDMSSGGTVRASAIHEASGGKAANAAFFCHRMEHPTLLLGRVGKDHYADVALSSPQSAGMNLQGVIRSDEDRTGIAVIVVPDSGDKTMINASSANMRWTRHDIDQTIARINSAPAGSILMVDFEVSHDLVAAAVAAAHDRDIAVLIDPTFPTEVDKALLGRVVAITPNQHEAEVLLGEMIRDERDALEAAHLLVSLGPATACVKLSDGGCVFADRNGSRRLLPIQVDVVDKTGAGDAFIGAVAVGLAEGRSIEEAALWGVAGSSFSVTRRDAQASYPTRAEFFHFLGRR